MLKEKGIIVGALEGTLESCAYPYTFAPLSFPQTARVPVGEYVKLINPVTFSKISSVAEELIKFPAEYVNPVVPCEYTISSVGHSARVVRTVLGIFCAEAV